MLNVLFVASLAVGLFALLYWGVRTLPGERWQMLAAVPIAKTRDGSWRSLNLTYYGFFSASGSVFAFSILLLLLASVRVSPVVGIALVLLILVVCVPASRIIAGVVERKRNTFTVAGAAFVATIILPWMLLAIRPLIATVTHSEIPALPVFAAAAIAYVLGESMGRLACVSFGCCYGMPLRDAHPLVARLFRKHHLVVHGSTKKAAYASGLAGEPLIPVQAITSAVFAIAGLAGIALFLSRQFRLAAVVPVLASWGWRACSEWLRADYRGTSRISAYQLMAVFSILYLSAFLMFVSPSSSAVPNLEAAFTHLSSVPMLLAIQISWVALFLYYGRSRVTASQVSFHVVTNRI